MSNPSVRNDVSAVFRFMVELDGLIVGGFHEVSGLQAETQLMEYVEGGVNDYVHQFPKQMKYPRIVLKRGMTSSSELWDWYDAVIAGKVLRKNGAVILQNQAGTELCRWNFFDAYPVKWSGPDLNATSSEIAIESIEMVHNGIKTIFNKK